MESFSPESSGNLTYTANGNTTTVSDLKFTFDAPGETKTFEFDIKNKGSIAAELLGINGTINDNGKLTCVSEDSTATGDTEEKTICGTNGTNDGAVTYKIEYDDHDVTSQGIETSSLTDKKLPAQTGTKHVKITVKYDGATIESTNLPTHKVTVTLPTISFDYGQDDSVE